MRTQKLMWRNIMRSTKNKKVSILHYNIDINSLFSPLFYPNFQELIYLLNGLFFLFFSPFQLNASIIIFVWMETYKEFWGRFGIVLWNNILFLFLFNKILHGKNQNYIFLFFFSLRKTKPLKRSCLQVFFSLS